LGGQFLSQQVITDGGTSVLVTDKGQTPTFFKD
jgi:hypothetical protein